MVFANPARRGLSPKPAPPLFKTACDVGKASCPDTINLQNACSTRTVFILILQPSLDGSGQRPGFLVHKKEHVVDVILLVMWLEGGSLGCVRFAAEKLSNVRWCRDSLT